MTTTDTRLLDVFELSDAALKALHKAGIQTVAEFFSKSHQRLGRVSSRNSIASLIWDYSCFSIPFSQCLLDADAIQRAATGPGGVQ